MPSRRQQPKGNSRSRSAAQSNRSGLGKLTSPKQRPVSGSSNRPAASTPPRVLGRPRKLLSAPDPESAVRSSPGDPFLPLTATERAAVTAVFSDVPRTEIAQVLHRAPIETDTDPESKALRRLAEMLDDPTYAELAWPQLCRKAGVAPAKLLRVLEECYLGDGRLRLARRMPSIYEALAAAAVDRIADCYVCEGRGKIEVEVEGDSGQVSVKTVTCRAEGCNNGKVYMRADIAAQNTAFRLMGAIDERPAVAQQFNFGSGGKPTKDGTVAGAVPDMAEWSVATDPVFEERRPAYEDQPQPQGPVE